MPDHALLDIVVAMLSGILGVACLYVSWRNLVSQKTGVRLAACGLLIVSAYFWHRFAGAEFGTAYFLLMFSLVAWGFVLINLERQQGNRPPQQSPTKKLAVLKITRRDLRNLIIAIPGAAVTSTLCSIVIAFLLPWSQVNRLVLALFIMPVIWGCLAIWVCADSKPGRPIITLIILSLVSTADILL